LRIAIIMFAQVFYQCAKLTRAIEINIVFQVRDNDASAWTAWKSIEKALKCADSQVAERRVPDRFSLSHLEIARQLIEKD